MQTDWLTDFMTLAETRSFSRAARLRHITQPAFSRRIRALEHWADATLVDRSHPPQLTPAGRLLLDRVPELTATMQRTQAMLRTHAPPQRHMLAFAATPELASGFFTAWITGLADLLDRNTTRMTVLEPRAALQHLLDGGCDLLLMHACEELPLDSQADRCEFLSLGHERLLPCTRPHASGAPLHTLCGPSSQTQPYLRVPDARITRAIDLALQRRSPVVDLQPVFECNSPETLKAMALAGVGIAFLPEHCVRPELDQGLLVPAGEALDLVLEIRLLRRRRFAGTGSAPSIDSFWDRLHDRFAPRALQGWHGDEPADSAPPRQHPESVVAEPT